MKHNDLKDEEWIKIYKNIDSVIVYFTINEGEKQDLYHDALLHVVKRFATNYHEKGKLDTWIKKVVINFCKDRITEYKRKNTSYYEELPYKSFIFHKCNIEEIKDKRALDILEESINELTIFDKQIIIGRLNNESYLSLAHKVNKNKNTIIRHYKKAQTVLQKKINQKYYEKYGTKYRENID